MFLYLNSWAPSFKHTLAKLKNLGATVIVNGLNDPNLLSIVFADPWGNEFELSRFHD